MKSRSENLIEAKLSAPQAIRARLLPPLPLSITFGGLELQCLKTCAALQQVGIAAKLLDYYSPDDEFDVLHLVGASENFYHICQYAAGRWPIVASAVSGAPSAAWWRAPIWLTASKFAQAAKLQTNYQRMRAVYGDAAAVICINDLESRFVQVTFGVARERIEIISNGVDEEYFQASGERFIERYGIKDFVLYTGNIVQRKNPLQLARVLRELDYPGIFIGGTVPTEQAYAETFYELVSNAPKIHWIPGLRYNDPLLPSAYAAARVFCLPSTSETQSLSALEAMAAGKPVILGDFPYAYQQPFEHSLRCNPADTASLRVCLQKAFSNPDHYGFNLPASYSWLNVAEKAVNVYRKVLTRRTA